MYLYMQHYNYESMQCAWAVHVCVCVFAESTAAASAAVAAWAANSFLLPLLLSSLLLLLLFAAYVFHVNDMQTQT